MRTEVIGDATLILGDCREVRSNARIKDRVGCRKCEWVWRPAGKTTQEACPQCGIVRDVRDRSGERKPNVEGIKAWRAANPGYSTQWERRYRMRALMLVGRGVVACVRCGCDKAPLLEINHKMGGGAAEHKASGRQFHRRIASLSRSVEDLELLCKPCNAVHALELTHGPLPFRVVWEPVNA